MEYKLSNEGLTSSLQKLLAQLEAKQRASMGTWQQMGPPGLDASIQSLLAENEAKQRACVEALQQMEGSGASQQWRASANYQQRAFPATIDLPMQHHTQEQQKLEDARRALQAALVNWQACYQEAHLCQPMVPGTGPVDSEMYDQLAGLASQSPFPVALPPGLTPPEASTPPILSPLSSPVSPYLNEAANPWYIPVTGQFFGKVQTAQHAQQKISPAKCAEKPTKMHEDVCDVAGDETLRTHLQKLLEFPSNCILIVRKINRLGFDSAKILKEQFSLRGTVLDVFVAHSRIKHANCKKGQTRWRPSGLGFVVMSRAEDVAAILKQGVEQNIHGCAIRVHIFERKEAMASMEMAEDKQQAMDGLREDESAENRLVGA